MHKGQIKLVGPKASHLIFSKSSFINNHMKQKSLGNDVRKLKLTPFCFEKSSVRKRIFNVKGVKKVRSALHHRISIHFKGNYAEKMNFHWTVILSDAL